MQQNARIYVAWLVARAVGCEGEIAWDVSKPDDAPRRFLDSSRMLALGWRQGVELETGLKWALREMLARHPELTAKQTRSLPEGA